MGRKEAFEYGKQYVDEERLNEILDLASDKKQYVCPRFNQKSYRNTKIKSLHLILQGKGDFSQQERDLFNERVEKIKEMKIGHTFTIKAVRQKGTRGTYEREACAYLICSGVLDKKIIYDVKDKKRKKPIVVYTRIDGMPCFNVNKSCTSKTNFCKCNKFIEKKQWVAEYDYEGFDKSEE